MTTLQTKNMKFLMITDKSIKKQTDRTKMSHVGFACVENKSRFPASKRFLGFPWLAD